MKKIRAYTRDVEFDFIEWMSNAAIIKIRAASLNLPYNIERATQKEIVNEYLQVTQTILEKENLLSQIYADPNIDDKETFSQDLRNELNTLYQRQKEIAPLAESILQSQVADVLAEIGLTSLGQPIPNVWYHSTPLPWALIVSPRDHIEQTANISLDANITVDQHALLESNIDKNLNTSSLVVPIGGVGVYPTMVARTTNLEWLLSTISHEWIHNYLMFRPLGIYYDASPETRTINETTASIAGDEIGKLVLEKFYPERLSASTHDIASVAVLGGGDSAESNIQNQQNASTPRLNLVSDSFDFPSPDDIPRPTFDFREQMYITRINADKLLSEGKIEEAEAYMEERRQIFLQNGYLLRKINQAYFAFYGAYADVPGGAAGEDPIGPAVRAFREQSDSLAEFVKNVAWITSLDELKENLESGSLLP
ncbi:MAG: hypothetical protein UZ14_CFX002000229 [Chloroflexi bacterium OLB14]|nr:MAG: hypothetical protein UZ14_CFX002000229 [Chloroflexi bacterium OLB14]